MKNSMGEDLVCTSSAGDRASPPSPIIASLITVEAVRVYAAVATVRRASTKILTHRNYPNYHVNGILRAWRCVFARSRLLATVIYARGAEPARARTRMLAFKIRAETHTRARMHARPSHELSRLARPRALPLGYAGVIVSFTSRFSRF